MRPRNVTTRTGVDVASAFISTTIFNTGACAIAIIAQDLISIIPEEHAVWTIHDRTCAFFVAARIFIFHVTCDILTLYFFRAEFLAVAWLTLVLVAGCHRLTTPVSVVIHAFESVAESVIIVPSGYETGWAYVGVAPSLFCTALLHRPNCAILIITQDVGSVIPQEIRRITVKAATPSFLSGASIQVSHGT
jgi:vacuolar-type H+-ATPase subunit F/Vma7